MQVVRVRVVSFAGAAFVASLAVVAWIVGHLGAYAVAAPGVHHDVETHAYMTPLEGAALSLALVALLAFAVAVHRAPRVTHRPLSPFALAFFAVVPSLVYVLVEIGEHVRVGELPAAGTLVVGLAFQLPLGPAAAIAARRLLRRVERLVAARGRGAVRLRAAPPRWRPRPTVPVRCRPLGGATAGRAPPSAY